MPPQCDHNNLTLILEIEKYQCLYNYNLAEYARKDVTDKAWAKISKKISISVNDCKEKWRNIRSAFLRSLKGAPSGSVAKSKRPYYLSANLKFILPYIKPKNAIENRNIPENVPKNEDSMSENGDDEATNGSNRTPSNELEVTSPTASDTQIFQSTSSSNETGHRRKRPIPEVETSFIDFLKFKTDQSQSTDKTRHCNSNDYNPMYHFLLSLLPEFDTMTENQKRHFKIEVMILLDRIKTGRYHSTTSTSTSTSATQVGSYSPTAS